MTDLEAIAKRTSRRKYDGMLSKPQMLRLEEVAAGVNLDTGLFVRLLEDGGEAFGGIGKSYGMFAGVHGLFLLAGPAGDEHLREKCGHGGERLVLEATKLGLGTCWVAGTYDRQKLAGSLPAGQELVAVITVGPVKENKSLMEKTVSRVVGGRRKAEDVCSYDADAPEWFHAGVQAALAAPSAMNRMPARFSYKDGAASARVEDASGTNLTDLGIAKLHFEVGAGGRFPLGNGAVFQKA